MKTHEDYIYTDKWFAWHPVRTTNKGWVWWCWTKRTIDDRPLVYQGLFEIKTYFKL